MLQKHKLLNIFVFLVATVAVVSADLNTDIEEIRALVPKNRLFATTIKHFLFDKQFGELRKYIKGPEFSAAWNKIMENKKLTDFLKYLEQKNVKIIKEINSIGKLLGQKRFVRSILGSGFLASHPALNKLFTEYMRLISIDRFLDFIREKSKLSEDFKELLKKIDLNAIEAYLKDTKETAVVLDKLKQLNIGIDRYTSIVKKFFGELKSPRVVLATSETI